MVADDLVVALGPAMAKLPSERAQRRPRMIGDGEDSETLNQRVGH